MVGIWEYHLNDLDEDLIRDVNEYMPDLMNKGWLKTKTKQLRVVPVAKSVSAEMAVTPFEAAEEIILKQSKIVVSDCICRKEQKMIGKGCDKPKEVCLAFGAGAYYYEKNGLGREIDKAEALAILKKGVEAGLVLQPGNQQKAMNICMCCGCCCGVLKNLKKMDKPARLVHTNYYAEVGRRCLHRLRGLRGSLPDGRHRGERGRPRRTGPLHRLRPVRHRLSHRGHGAETESGRGALYPAAKCLRNPI